MLVDEQGQFITQRRHSDLCFFNVNAFKAVKPCSRCVVTTIDPQSALRSPEPLQTLSKYRLQDGKVMFGMNVLPFSGALIQVRNLLSE